MVKTALPPAELLKLYDAGADSDSRIGINNYLKWLCIDSSPRPQRFKNCREDWQDDFYDVVGPMIESACGYDVEAKRLAFIQMARGHSKTSSVAQLLNWALRYSRRHVQIVCAAADADQGHLILERMAAEAKWNPWLSGLEFQSNGAYGPNGELEVLTSDAPTSMGKLADIYVIDELVWHRNRNLFDSLFTARNKRPECCFIIITNAGIIGTWQHEFYEKACTDQDNWYMVEIPAFSASWMDRKAIESDKALLPGGFYTRVYLNKWVRQDQTDPYVTEEQVLACINPDSSPATRGRPGQAYVLSLDLGVTNDRAVACVQHLDDDDQVILDDMTVWVPQPGQRIQLIEIERHLDRIMELFYIRKLILDPWQAEGLAQKYEQQGVEVERFNFGGQSHTRIADNLRTLIITRKLVLYPGAGFVSEHDDLVDELSNLVVEYSKDGRSYRFNHLPRKHDDRACALALGCLGCITAERLMDLHTVLDQMISTNKPSPELKAEVKQELKAQDKVIDKLNQFFALDPFNQESDMYGETIEIKKIRTYGTYQAIPVLDGAPIRLVDWPTMHEAAVAVNAAHKWFGDEQQPCQIDVKHLPKPERVAEIVKATIEHLVKLGAKPLVKQEVKPTGKKPTGKKVEDFTELLTPAN